MARRSLGFALLAVFLLFAFMGCGDGSSGGGSTPTAKSPARLDARSIEKKLTEKGYGTPSCVERPRAAVTKTVRAFKTPRGFGPRKVFVIGKKEEERALKPEHLFTCQRIERGTFEFHGPGMALVFITSAPQMIGFEEPAPGGGQVRVGGGSKITVISMDPRGNLTAPEPVE